MTSVHLETTALDRNCEHVVATLERPAESENGELEIRGEAVFTEVRYERNDRGTRELVEGRSRTIDIDATKEGVSESDATCSVQIPVPSDLLTDSTYYDGLLDVTLTIEVPGEGTSEKTTVENEPIVVGRPTFEIDPREEKQVIDGFGASGAWWAQNVGGWEDVREWIADRLFSVDEGIGLSIYRYNATGGEMSGIRNDWRTGETYEIAEGEYDWNRDENGRWMARAANARDVETFVLFTKTPPARITKNGKTYAEAEIDSNLDPDHYEQFAQYLADIADHFRREEGITFDLVSPINEPEWDWIEPNQEGTPYTVSQILDLSNVILEAFEEEDVRSELLIPEAGAWRFVYDDRNYAERLHRDSTLREELSVLAVHSYWSTDEQRHAAAERMAEYPETRVWQTEWCEMVPDRDLGMDFALNLANTVHADLTIANTSSWQFWLAVSEVDYRDGLIYVDTDTKEAIDSQALWTFGNYTRFIRPGAVRIDVGSNHDTDPDWKNDAGISVSAYLGPEREAIVIVAINETDRRTETRVVVESDAPELTLTPHRTSESEPLEALEDVTIDSRDADRLEGEVTLAPRSVTTYTGELT